MRNADTSIRLLQRAITFAAYATTICLGLIGVANLALQASSLFSLDEAGYGDSYILYDILHLQSDGYIYRDLSKPPYLPAQYGPLLYILLAAPGRLFALANPFIGPRLVVLAAFLGCTALVVSTTRKLTGHGRILVLPLMVAASVAPTWEWILQLRSDFIGLLFSLMAIRFLLTDDRRHVWSAGLCAGMAVQMKITLLTAGLSGFIWLVLQRRWTDLARFTAAGAVASAGIFFVYYLREPQMLAQMTALSPGVPNMPGAIHFATRAALEPVVIVAMVTAPALLFFHERGWQLLLLFAVLAAVIASATVVQAGANLNYYLELFFAAVPIATAGLLRLKRSVRPLAYGLALALVFVAILYPIPPRVRNLSREISRWVPVSERNEQLAALASVVTPSRTVSTVPRLALFDAEPLLVEPFLLSYLDRLGRPSHAPVVTAIRQGDAKAVFTAAVSQAYRGIPRLMTPVKDAISAAYVPYCVISLSTQGPILVHVPIVPKSRDETLMRGLDSLGCERASPRDAARW